MTLYSNGAEALAAVLTPQGPSGIRVFPPLKHGWKASDIKAGANEFPGAWLRRVSHLFIEERIDRCQHDEGLGMVVLLKWEDGDRLTHLSLQCVVSPTPQLETMPDEVPYFRLDFGTDLGPAFAEPLPHVHVRGKGAPRFPLRTTNPAGAFLDFIYRNYFHDTWATWAEIVWDSADDRQSFPLSTFADATRAFTRNDGATLRGDLRPAVISMKKAWARELAQAFPLRVSTEECELLSLP